MDVNDDLRRVFYDRINRIGRILGYYRIFSRYRHFARINRLSNDCRSFLTCYNISLGAWRVWLLNVNDDLRRVFYDRLNRIDRILGYYRIFLRHHHYARIDCLYDFLRRRVYAHVNRIYDNLSLPLMRNDDGTKTGNGNRVIYSRACVHRRLKAPHGIRQRLP